MGRKPKDNAVAIEVEVEEADNEDIDASYDFEEDDESEELEDEEIDPDLPPEVVLNPDLIITIKGLDGAGKTVLAAAIASRLKARPLGYCLRAEEPDCLIKNYRRITKSDIASEPEWDEKKRIVLIQKETVSSAEIVLTPDQEQLNSVGSFIIENFPNHYSIDGGVPAGDAIISIVKGFLAKNDAEKNKIAQIKEVFDGDNPEKASNLIKAYMESKIERCIDDIFIEPEEEE